jgi:hypothetical protein
MKDREEASEIHFPKWEWEDTSYTPKIGERCTSDRWLTCCFIARRSHRKFCLKNALQEQKVKKT